MKYEIILAKFHYLEKKTFKLRPVLCLTDPMEKYDLVIVAYISSKVDSFNKKNDVLLDAECRGFAETNLKTDSVIKLNRITTVSSSNVLGKLGNLPKVFIPEIRKKLTKIFNL